MNTPRERGGVFSRLFAKIGFEKKDAGPTGSLSNPDPWLFELFSGGIEPTIAGVDVNPSTQ